MSTHVAHLHSGSGWGGGEHQILHLLPRLVDQGIRTTLFAAEGGELMARAKQANLSVRPLLSVFQASSEKFDLLHAHDSASLSIGIRLKRRSHLPLIYSRRIASRLRRNPLSRRKYNANHIDTVIAISETVRQVFSRGGFPAERIVVVTDGLDLESLARVRPDPHFQTKYPRDYLICGVGCLSKKKNWSFMVDVAAAARTKGISATWLLAGDGREREVLRQTIFQYGLQDQFHLLGFREDVLTLIKSSDLLFFPSRMEGASVTVREAMALGTPVVAVDAAGTVESLDGHGWIISDGDVDSAVVAVCAALTDEDQRTKHTLAAAKSARSRFSMEDTVQRTVEVYRRHLT